MANAEHQELTAAYGTVSSDIRSSPVTSQNTEPATENGGQGTGAEQTKEGTIRILVTEEQPLYREVYKSLPLKAPIEVLLHPYNGDIAALVEAVSQHRPDTVLLGTKKISAGVIEQLEQVRTRHPETGIILLLMFYNIQDVELLRRLASNGEGGMALILKQSLNQIEQLHSIILAVSQGQIILDPLLVSLILDKKPTCAFLKDLTRREKEILSLVAQGYTNRAIADALYIDVKTVEHHLNSMYTKLKAEPNFIDKHLRVSATRLYLKAMGDLPV